MLPVFNFANLLELLCKKKNNNFVSYKSYLNTQCLTKL